MSARAGWLGAARAAGRRRRSRERRAARHQRGPGAGGEEALVGNQARKQLHTMAALAEGQSRHSGGASEDWGRRGGTGGGPAPTDIEEPAGGVMSRLRCGRSSDSDGRDLRFAGLVQPARPHHSTAPEEQGERCRTSAVGSG